MSLDLTKVTANLASAAIQTTKSFQKATNAIAQNSQEVLEKNLGAMASQNAPLITKSDNFITEVLNDKLQNIYRIQCDIKDKNLLKLLYEAVVDFCTVNKKPKMFQGLKVKTDDLGTEFFTTSIYDGFEIVYNSNPEKWANIQEKLQKFYDKGEIATVNKKYFQYASLGDFLNFSYNPYAYKVCQNRSYCEDSLKITGRITSLKSLDKFNQDYIAARMSGVQCPKTLETYFLENCGNADLIFPEIGAKFYKGAEFDFKTIEEVQQFLEKYGIQATFTDLKQANATVSAVQDLINATDNPDIFQGLIIKSDAEKYSDVLLTRGECCWDLNNANAYIALNPAYNWKRAEIIEQESFDNLFHPTNRPKDSIIHELVHYLDFKGNPQKYTQTYNAFRNGRYYNDTGILYTSKVSKYAASEPAEFCAEYVVGRLAGIQYPKCTNDEFLSSYNGINIHFPKPVINVN